MAILVATHYFALSQRVHIHQSNCPSAWLTYTRSGARLEVKKLKALLNFEPRSFFPSRWIFDLGDDFFLSVAFGLKCFVGLGNTSEMKKLKVSCFFKLRLSIERATARQIVKFC